LLRAKDKLRAENVKIEFPGKVEINKRLETVLRTLYLIFNEGYYSASNNITLRKDLCFEAMRLTHLLLENEETNKPAVNALFSLMSFQSSRFEARMDQQGEIILYDDQDTKLWNKELIEQGEQFLNIASEGDKLSKYHLEAGIAYWHTIKADTAEKWENILQLYNHLLQLEYSPIAALNRTYALSKANGKAAAIIEAQKLNLANLHLYHLLLGELYTDVDNGEAKSYLEQALKLASSAADTKIITQKIERLIYLDNL
jgi:RNA polymerase sigma-70 factor (ECF subfamily)